MLNKFASPIDYLFIGHLTSDLLSDGSTTLGGAVSYGSLTANKLKMRPGILTSYSESTSIEPLADIPMAGVISDHTSTFENIYTPEGRIQKLHFRADHIRPYMLPQVWRNPAIVQFAPMLDEIDMDLFRIFPNAMICVTPQGWLRDIKKDNVLGPVDWLESQYILEKAAATVLSIEDISCNERTVAMYAEAADIFVVTEGEKGCRLYLYGRPIRIPAPKAIPVDPTGAGDIFATVFFTVLFRSEDPEAAARAAVKLATCSVARQHMSSIPTESEIYETLLNEPNSEWASTPL